MKVKTIIVTMFLLAGISACHKKSAAGDGRHHHGNHDPGTMDSRSGKMFETDADLRKRMSEILHIMQAMHDSTDKINLPETGKKIEAIVDEIFQECKLEPEADATLHPVLEKILDGANDFKEGKEGEGHEKIHHAFLMYEASFIHEGWNHNQ